MELHDCFFGLQKHQYLHIDDGKQLQLSCVAFREQPLSARCDEQCYGVLAVKVCRRAAGYHVGEKHCAGADV